MPLRHAVIGRILANPGAAATARDLVRMIEETIADSLIAARHGGSERITLRDLGDAIVAETVA